MKDVANAVKVISRTSEIAHFVLTTIKKGGLSKVKVVVLDENGLFQDSKLFDFSEEPITDENQASYEKP